MVFKPFHKGSTTVGKGQKVSDAPAPSKPAAKQSPAQKKQPNVGNQIGKGPANQSGFFHNDRSQMEPC